MNADRVSINGVMYEPVRATPADVHMQALSVRFDSDAGKLLSVREYLCRLLQTLWSERDCFSGKRPFGNSGWAYDLYRPLIAAGFVSGEVDALGSVRPADKAEADAFIAELIPLAMGCAWETEE